MTRKHHYLIDVLTHSLTNLADTEMIAAHLAQVSEDQNLREECETIHTLIQHLRKHLSAYQDNGTPKAA